ncbi:hypothetical protein WFK62_13695 [Yersinia enterocolitica]|uniref:hypothetical protein n=1 Tax=Yersinia enterocolitica TaxID=630 RepID=UPI0005E78C41|nr:hypothetical protein [Yersinia enterocolitica]CQJ26375.1 Uncharacterised protein [Yersinia enterocolitica]CRY60415.1 Uncharacterised protein [Yersinia kristensenii]
MAEATQAKTEELVWPSFYPSNVPPNESTDASGVFYRLVRVNPPSDQCFQSTHEEQPHRHKKLKGDALQNVFGASFYSDKNRAIDTRDKFPEALGDRLLAEGDLQPYMGKMKQTFKPFHFTVWLKVGCNISRCFSCIEGDSK